MEQGFKKLLAWQKADDLAAEIFRLTEDKINPRHRWLGLQIIRAAFSVTSNIAEGYGRSSLGDYLRFLEIAGASLNEVENGLHFIKRNGVIPAGELEAAEQLRQAASNLVFGLARSLNSKLKNKETWQRGLIREQPVDYGINPEEREFLGPEFQIPVPNLQVPSSKFQVPEV